jgi:Acyl-CoA dehydrogenase, C-terminal domain
LRSLRGDWDQAACTTACEQSALAMQRCAWCHSACRSGAPLAQHWPRVRSFRLTLPTHGFRCTWRGAIPEMEGLGQVADADRPNTSARSLIPGPCSTAGGTIPGLQCTIVCRCRLTVLHAASLLDNVGNKAAQLAITAAKVATPKAVLHALDIAIQLHGAAGKPLAQSYWHITSSAVCLRNLSSEDQISLSLTMLPAVCVHWQGAECRRRPGHSVGKVLGGCEDASTGGRPR